MHRPISYSFCKYLNIYLVHNDNLDAKASIITY